MNTSTQRDPGGIPECRVIARAMPEIQPGSGMTAVNTGNGALTKQCIGCPPALLHRRSPRHCAVATLSLGDLVCSEITFLTHIFDGERSMM